MPIKQYDQPGGLSTTAGVLKAAGEPSRLRALKALEGGELCGCHVVEILGLSQPTVSRHMAILVAAGLVAERREGRWTIYRLARRDPLCTRLLRLVRECTPPDPALEADRDLAARLRDGTAPGSCATPRGRRR